MPRDTTRLAYILMRLGIRPGQLAAHTGIDKTLISRWRGGERRLAPGSDYTKKFVDFILLKDPDDSILSKTLLAYGLDESTGTLRENLDFWLSEQGLPRPSLDKRAFHGSAYTSTFSVFTGPNNIENALITLFDYVISKALPTNIIILALDNSQPLANNDEFVDAYLERIAIAGRRGIKTTMIYRPHFVPDLQRMTKRWMEAILGGHLTLCRYDGPDITDSRNLVGALGVVSARINRDPSVADSVYVSMFTEQRTVQHIYGICEHYAAASTPIFRPNFFAGKIALPGPNQTPVRNNDFFAISGTPLFAATPGAELVRLSRASRSAVHSALSPFLPLFTRPDEFAPHNRIRLVYCTDQIAAILTPGRVQDPLLSFIFGRPVNRSRKMLLQQLVFLHDMLQKCGNLEVALLPQRLFDKIPAECVGSDGQFFIAWLPGTGESAYFPCDGNVFSTTDFFTSIWDALPPASHDRAAVSRQLVRWVRQCTRAAAHPPAQQD